MAYDGLTNPVSPIPHQITQPGLSLQAGTGSESLHLDDDPATTYALANNRRKSSLKMPGLLKRAVSSPNVGSLALEDTMSMSEKKRNKLGYHRTAVACG